MGIATGVFSPTALFGQAEEAFRPIEGTDVDVARELTTDLELRTSSGERVPTEWIRVEDFSKALGAEGYEITVCAEDAATFGKYFVS
jgi:hypothetical protein